ncbi:MAG: dienelactone hydrolase family protein [Motiliproteus sp.]
MVFQRNWEVRYSNMVTQTIVDYRRAIDYLATRGDIDTDRVGLIGYSMGGHMTFILGASEPRIKTIVGCVVPEMAGVLSAASTFTRSLGDKPLLMMMAQKDKWYTVEAARQLFKSIPGYITRNASGRQVAASFSVKPLGELSERFNIRAVPLWFNTMDGIPPTYSGS